VLFNECGDSLCEHINKRRRRYERERCCSLVFATAGERCVAYERERYCALCEHINKRRRRL